MGNRASDAHRSGQICAKNSDDKTSTNRSFSSKEVAKKCPSPPGLTAYEKKLIKRSWKSCTKANGSLENVGAEIFLRIFTIAPESKRLFRFQNVPPERLQYNDRFLYHAATFSSVLDTAVEDLDEVTKIRPDFR